MVNIAQTSDANHALFLNLFPCKSARMPRLLHVFVFAVLAVPFAWMATAASPSTLRVQVVDERGLPVRDAVVEAEPTGGWRGPVKLPGRAAMAQKNLSFVPGTLVVAKGSNVAFPNLDRVRHSVYSFSKPARFEIDLYGRQQTRSQKFAIAGAVSLGCNIHDDMRGYIKVVDTPFAAKTDGNGYVTLRGVPGGSTSVSVWHPRMRAPGNTTRRTLALAGNEANQKFRVRLR